MTANSNRDPKKQRKPFQISDFCFFIDTEADKPDLLAAAAYMRLLEDGLLPAWAMFCFADFKHAKPSPASPEKIALIGEGFLLLSPAEITGGYEGLFIAEASASDQTRPARYEGSEFAVKLPKFSGYTYAKSGIELDVVSARRPV